MYRSEAYTSSKLEEKCELSERVEVENEIEKGGLKVLFERRISWRCVNFWRTVEFIKIWDV